MPDVQNCHDDNLSTPRKTQKGRIERFGLSLFSGKNRPPGPPGEGLERQIAFDDPERCDLVGVCACALRLTFRAQALYQCGNVVFDFSECLIRLSKIQIIDVPIFNSRSPLRELSRNYR